MEVMKPCFTVKKSDSVVYTTTPASSAICPEPNEANITSSELANTPKSTVPTITSDVPVPVMCPVSQSTLLYFTDYWCK